MRPRARVLCVTASLLATAVAARAQTAPRLFVTVNAAAQTAGDDFTDRREFEVGPETATSEARHPLEAGRLFDVGAAVRLWKRFGAGVSVSHFSTRSNAAVVARIPHPFFFDRHREISGDSGRARRSETGVHVQMRYDVAARGRLRGVMFGGASFLSARQDLVSEVRYDEEFPYDRATFTAATLTRGSGSGAGFHVGADVFWMFGNRFGAGALVRFTRAPIDLDVPQNRRLGIDAGGLHVGGGGRVMF